MHLSGQPLHAFDLDRLQGGIAVRRAGRGERMKTLDGIDRPLQESDIVIADARGAIALAGVMGGLGKIASFASGERETYHVVASVGVKGAAFNPHARVQVTLK